jgi:hypothetical protein
MYQRATVAEAIVGPPPSVFRIKRYSTQWTPQLNARFLIAELREARQK